MSGTVGRPRKNSPRRRGKTARDEILDASSELFTMQGFATTSTHQIADAVGIRQASLYYHFPSKTEIFLTLLMGTVEPALDLAKDLSETDESPALKLWALVAAETRILLSSNWNIGRLYQLPVANSEEFHDYHDARRELEDVFRELAAEIVGDDDPRIDLPFQMTLAAIELRDNTGKAPYPLVDDALPAPSVMIADAVLDVLHAELPDNRGMRTLDLVSKVTDGGGGS
ncbi:TetR/AcrR family transcriptional regulator [Corynebacterium liangguodongii]|uniref:TetR/AcrR family transcriptional regulator n=1 Tax=Corynebacterium liangguodongii TaxID=2079535 RepID=A0A2S0WD21_9CORY|nr:TetR/AcrR family transcriptional regulator [Corynebacterium liangguodongii]AWB83661.1 TetR/AcrR family transcriptional regulator [Corynebacterium liangguodongii]PWB99530.1 TetR/AcrR family transcriptional regulator [Corynebacterium liangguodongii]